MKEETCDTLSGFEESDEQYVFDDGLGRLEQVVSVDATYDDEGIPEGTVIVEDIASGEQRDVDADDFDTALHCGERTVVSTAVIENAEEIMVELGRTWINEMRIHGRDHEFRRVDHAETVRDLLAADTAYQAASAN